MSRPASAEAEQRLVAECLRGDDDAWDRLYRLTQRQLLLSIRLMLRPKPQDDDLVNDIAGQVWLWLVESDDCLSKFDSKRGNITTYLAALARDSVRRHYRSEHRRLVRERKAVRREAMSVTDFQSALEGFLTTLTPHEREFCEQYLLAHPDALECRSYSPANIRQLRHRVFVKLRGYLA